MANYSDVPPKKGAKEALWLKRGRQLAVGFDGRIFTAGTGERYMSGGKIAWTDPKTMVTDSLGGPFEFLPVSALKSIQGGKKLAGGTWLMRHHGKKVPQPFEATIFQFDVLKDFPGGDEVDLCVNSDGEVVNLKLTNITTDYCLVLHQRLAELVGEEGLRVEKVDTVHRAS